MGLQYRKRMHQEVIENLKSIQGALLRVNHSIQEEGTFGIIKNDRWDKRSYEEEWNPCGWRYFRFLSDRISINSTIKKLRTATAA